MTVSSQINKIIYIGNGVAKEFAIPFSFLEQEHLKVRQKKNDIQTERTDWTVKNGNLVFTDAPESGAEIAIVREVPMTQETDYRDNEILHAETLERNFDKLTMQVQQLAEKSARAVTVDIFDDTAADSLIPGIRKAVSDAAAYATTAQNKAQEASQEARNASNSAQISSDKATIATKKATEVSNALSTKVDTDLSNCTRPYITETYHNGTEWYRVWSDGWIEQGGNILSGTHLFFKKAFTTTDYTVTGNETGRQAEDDNCRAIKFRNINANTCYVIAANNPVSVSWKACGY